MKPSPLLPLAIPSLATASTITLTATPCSSTANQDLTPFTINLPINQLTNLDSAICQLSITATSSDLDLSSVFCTVYAPDSNVDLDNPLPSILSPDHPIINVNLGSVSCAALSPSLASSPTLPTAAAAAVKQRRTATLKDKRSESTGKPTSAKKDSKRDALPAKGARGSPTTDDGSKPTGKSTDGTKDVKRQEEKREPKPTNKDKESPTTDDGSKPTGKSTDGKNDVKRQEEGFESGESVGKRGTTVDNAAAGARGEMGVFAVGILAIGIAVLVM